MEPWLVLPAALIGVAFILVLYGLSLTGWLKSLVTLCSALCVIAAVVTSFANVQPETVEHALKPSEGK